MGIGKNTDRKQRALSLLLVLLVLGLRVLFVPMHMAHEEHLGLGAHVVPHTALNEVHAEDDLADGIDHGEHSPHDHPPHAVDVHATNLMARKAPSTQGAPHLVALVEIWCLPSPSLLTGPLALGSLPPPSLRTRCVLRLRGPPAVS